MFSKLQKLFLLVLWVGFLKAHAATYSIEDLEVLERDGNYEEFFQHAYDIRPSQRTRHWQDMAQSMAKKFYQDKKNLKIYSKETFLYSEKLAKIDSLKRDEFFNIYRNEFSVKYFRQCFQNKDLVGQKDCLADLKQFWNNSDQQEDMAYLLAKMIEETQIAEDLWPFYQKTTVAKDAHIYCAKSEIQNSLLIKLYDKIGKDESESNISKSLFRLANEQCLKTFLPSLRVILNSQQGQSFSVRHIAFLILNNQKMLTQKETDRYYALFLLQGPVIGETFNMAWTTMEKIGQDFQRRQHLLTELRQMDPLPGKIFNSSTEASKKAVVSLLAKNLPEYFDYYAKTCVNYLKGTETFPNGNPTVECHDLFNTACNQNWISDSIQTEYSSVKKY